jgi:hypothetical protein
MKSYQCQACGYKWFEPRGNTERSINWGCPNGCDATGTEVESQWQVWILTHSEMKECAENCGYSIEDFNPAQLDQIAHRLMKGFESAASSWTEWLEYAICEVAQTEGIKRQKNRFDD